MGLFYNSKTPKNEQLAYKLMFPLLIIVTISLISIGHVVCIDGLVKLTAYLSLPITLCFIVPVHTDPNLSKKPPTSHFWKRCWYYISSFMIIYLLIWLVLSDTLPGIYTQFTGDLINAKYEVTSRRASQDGSYVDRWSARGCRTQIWVRETNASWESSACPTKKYWEQVAIGDIVNGKHKESMFGYIIQELNGENI